MLKKTLAAIMASAMLAVSLTGCSKAPATVASYDGGEIPAGVYIFNQYQQYAQYENYFGAVPFSEKNEEGITMKESMNETSLKAIKVMAASEAECQRLGITITDEEKEQVITSAHNEYNKNKETYEKKGIGVESFEATAIGNYMTEKLFGVLYAPGGELEPTKEEKQKFLDETYRSTAVITLPLTDDVGTPFPQEEVKKLYARADKLLEDINSGNKSFIDTFKEVNAKKGYEIPDMFTELRDISLLIKKGDNRFAESFLTELFLNNDTSRAYAHKGQDIIYIYQILDISDGKLADSMSLSLIHEMKNEDYMEYLLKKSEEINFTPDEKALKAYSVEKIADR